MLRCGPQAGAPVSRVPGSEGSRRARERSGAAIDAHTGVFTWTPTEAQGQGDYSFTVRVSDDQTPSLFDEETITVTVNEVNVAPVLAPIGHRTIDELATLTFTAVATDDDLPANALTFSLVGAPAGTFINAATGAFTWTPTEAQGPGDYSFRVRVTDQGSPIGRASCRERVSLTV